MSEVKITAEKRNQFGKGAARRIRRSAQIPAVLYAHGSTPVHITMPGHDTMLALKNANALLSLEIEGTNVLALPKDVQRDPIKGFIEHIDLVIVTRGEKVEVEVAIHVIGDAVPETVVMTEQQFLLVEAEATHIPTGFDVSVEGLRAGTQIHASDVKLPPGTTLVTDPSILVVNITQAATAEQLDAELAEAEADLGIEHEPSDAEEAEAAAEAETEAGEGTDADAAEGKPTE